MNAATLEATTPDTQRTIEWFINVSACSIWIEGTHDGFPSVSFIDAVQRRRLSALAKASIGVMHTCVGEVHDYHTVYASRHGELARTTELLNQLAAGEEVSPMGFSLAVPNSTAGVYAIATGNKAPISAVSAGAQTFEMGLLEAATQAQAGSRPILFIYADAPVPAIYGWSCEQATPMHAIAMLIHADKATDRVGLRLSRTMHDSSSSQETQAMAFVNAWSAERDGAWCDGSHQFAWSFL